MQSSIFNTYTGMVDLSGLSDYCRKYGRMYRYAKGDTFVRIGSVGRYLGFVESGYFRYTAVTSEGDEAVVGFAFEGEGVCDFINSYCGHPSEIDIIAGCDSTVRLIDFSEAKSFIRRNHGDLNETVLTALSREIYHRYLELYRKSPTQRYLDLLHNHPHIFDIVTMREIASYLLVTPVYLSRIRKKLSENRRK